MQKSQFLFILSLIFAVLVTIFALTNSNPVVINLFFYEFTGSLALVIFLSAMLGALIVMFLGIARFFRFRMEVKRISKEKDVVIKEKEALAKEKDLLSTQVLELNKKIAELSAPVPTVEEVVK